MIFGLSGTNGAGKDAVGEILQKDFNYLFISVTDLLREEARRRGLEVIRENLRDISAEWRRQEGMDVLIQRALVAYEPVKTQYAGLVISSLRHPAEADGVHAAGGKVVWVDADPRVRYERVQKNAAHRNRKEEDSISFREFMEHERIEMSPRGDEATLHTIAVKEKVDVILYNEAEGLSELARQVKTNLLP